MRRFYAHKSVAFAAALALLAFASSFVIGDELNSAAQTIADGEAGVILLQDGGVLQGQVTRAADWYVVGRGSGQMQIAAARVMFVGHSLPEAYQYRRDHATLPTPAAHLTLADWCLRYELLNEAAAELDTARSMDDSSPRLTLLDRRLATARNRPTIVAAQPPATQPLASSAPIAASVRVPAAAAGIAEQPTPAAESRDLAPGVLENFTRKVQPVLVNNCTVSKCHEPGGHESFQMNRAMLRGEANRQTTMQNLAAAIALVDREHPERSPLLTVPRQTHGGMNGPIFGPRQDAAFKHLAEWVAMVAPPKQPAAEESAGAPPTIAAAPHAIAVAVPGVMSMPRTTHVPRTVSGAKPNPLNRNPPVMNAIGIEDSSAPPDGGVVPAAAEESAPAAQTLRGPHRIQYGVTEKSWQPRDAFDPEIFNRRQRATSQRKP